MHAGKIESSTRLQDTYAVLADGKWHSTRDIGRLTGSCAVHSDIAGLRDNGFKVERRQNVRMMTRIYEYKLAGGTGGKRTKNGDRSSIENKAKSRAAACQV